MSSVVKVVVFDKATKLVLKDGQIELSIRTKNGGFVLAPQKYKTLSDLAEKLENGGVYYKSYKDAILGSVKEFG